MVAFLLSCQKPCRNPSRTCRQEHIAYVTSLLMPMYIMIPIVAARWTGGEHPLGLSMAVYPLRLATGPLTALLAFYTPASLSPTPWLFYLLLVLVIALAATTSEPLGAARPYLGAQVDVRVADGLLRARERPRPGRHLHDAAEHDGQPGRPLAPHSGLLHGGCGDPKGL